MQEGGKEMKTRMRVLSGLVLIAVIALNIGGCSKFFGPSDEEVIKAINDTGLFSGGVEKFSMKAPIVIVDKGMFRHNGAWPVKVKLTYTYMMTGGKETKATEREQTFMIAKSKDSSGNVFWQVVPGQ